MDVGPSMDRGKAPTMRVDLRHAAWRALRTHGLFGDAIALNLGAETAWLSPDGDVSIDSGRLERRYLSQGGVSIVLDWGPHAADFVDAVAEAGRLGTTAAFREKWADFLVRIGRPLALDRDAFGRSEIRLGGSGPFVAARRPAHPDPMVDRLLMGDRAYEADRIDALLFDQLRPDARLARRA